MVSKVLSGLLAIALSAYLLTPLFAETVVLKSGQTLKGTLLVKKDDLYKQYIASGQSYLQAEKYSQAIEQFAKAINLEPKFAQSYYNRALAYVKLATTFSRQDNTENLSQALKDCTKAIELEPNDAASYNTRAFVYYLLGKQKYDAGLLNSAWADVHKLEELKATLDPKFIEELKQASAGEK